MRGFGFYHGYGMGGGLGLLFLVLLKVVFVVVVVVVIVAIARRMHRHGHGPMMMHGMDHGDMAGVAPTVPGGDEAVAIARKRLASGEITKEQFDELMKTLGSEV